jgi:hypothetical protein
MFDFGMYGNEVEKRIICTNYEFERWQSGQTVYLVKEGCFAEYNLEYISEDDLSACLSDPRNNMSMAQGRYAYTREAYDTRTGVIGSFELLSDEERQSYYVENILAEYKPVFYSKWVEDGNDADDIIWTVDGKQVSLKAITMRLHAKTKTKSLEESEELLNG